LCVWLCSQAKHRSLPALGTVGMDRSKPAGACGSTTGRKERSERHELGAVWAGATTRGPQELVSFIAGAAEGTRNFLGDELEGAGTIGWRGAVALDASTYRVMEG
jgi:hypothetical protein